MWIKAQSGKELINLEKCSSVNVKADKKHGYIQVQMPSVLPVLIGEYEPKAVEFEFENLIEAIKNKEELYQMP